MTTDIYVVLQITTSQHAMQWRTKVIENIGKSIQVKISQLITIIIA